jgi:hypothetical protein
LSDVCVFQIQAGAPRDTLLVHQAGHVGRDHLFSAVTNLIVSLVQTHSGRDRLVGHAEGTAKAAAAIPPVNGYEHQTLHLCEEVGALIERRAHDLGWFGDPRPRIALQLLCKATEW